MKGARQQGWSLWSILLAACALLSLRSPALAHDFFLLAENFRPKLGESIELAPMIGHGRDRQRWLADPRRIRELRSISDAGIVDHFPTAVPVQSGQNIRIALASAGTHVVGLATDHARSDLPPDRFKAYLEEEGLKPILAERSSRGEELRAGREIYSRCAKVVVDVGGSASSAIAITRPLRLKLEIVPEDDPRRARSATPVRILYDARNLPGALVKLRRLDGEEGPAVTFETDRDGRIRLPALRSGVWQLNVVWSTRLSQHPWADFESTFSSLTFEVAKPTSQRN